MLCEILSKFQNNTKYTYLTLNKFEKLFYLQKLLITFLYIINNTIEHNIFLGEFQVMCTKELGVVNTKWNSAYHQEFRTCQE